MSKFQEGFLVRNSPARHFRCHMKTLASPTFGADESIALFGDPKEQFRARFQRALALCVSYGFCIEESFGMVFNETLDEVPMSDKEQAELYEELIRWAKRASF